ncbi:MAG: SDR family oxidoreductase [Pseudomonadota bacterium]
MSRFDGKVALVTGGRSGIGAAIAARFAAEGARVWTAQRGPDPVHQSIAADFLDPESPAKVVEQVLQAESRLDVLINNAGLMEEAPAEATTDAMWHRSLAVNLTAPFLTIRAAVPALRATGGAIVNIGSVEGLGNNPGHAAYGAAKAGLHGLTRAVAVDHGPDGVRCNAVAPGWIDTDLNEDYIASMQDPAAFREGLSGIHPIGRTGTPEDIAALVAFLASYEAGFITGQVYTIDGGRMTQLSLP